MADVPPFQGATGRATHTVVRQALCARRWALRVLAGGNPEPAPALSAQGWSLFLEAERCALALQRRLGEGASVLGAGEPVLRHAATLEMMRAMSLQAQLRTVAPLLRRNGWPGIVLKSGAELAGGGDPVDVADVDLLVAPEHAAPLARALEQEGPYATVGRDAAPGSREWEAAKRLAPGSVMIEIHHSVPYLGPGIDFWADPRPTRVAGVLRPAPALHLWHLLVHGVVHHPERVGTVRDLLLMAAAFRNCSAGEVAWVRARTANALVPADLVAMLDAAAALAAGKPPRDRFEVVAAVRYRLYLSPQPGALARVFPRTWPAAFALASGREAYRALWVGSQKSALVPSAFRGDTRLDHVAPRLSHLLRTSRRVLLLAASTPGAWMLARGAARDARSSR
ncbi:MAG TPA: nucleotidyltransferase family protein [Longimicrobium sp.]|jgi:hypothetical protein|uniref:nucleotidyltransferase family protein n=1 Tax=Longimicrobium sp. TaxID=2029185 RepID=UPI002ED90D5A